MQNFLMLAPAIAKTGSFGSSAGDGRVGMVDTRDVAAFAAQIAASPAAHRGKTYWPTGPESLSYADAAAVLSKVLGQPVTVHPLTFEEQKQAGAGELALLTGAPTYTNCAADTDLGGSLNSLVPGNIIC